MRKKILLKQAEPHLTQPIRKEEGKEGEGRGREGKGVSKEEKEKK